MSRVYYGYKIGVSGVVVTGCDLDYEGEVIIPESVYGDTITGIEPNAFRYCSKITSVTIPNSVTSIGEYAFCECTSLESVTISSIYEVPTGCFKGCKNLKNINFSPAIIGDYSFENCTSLTSLSSSFLNSIQQIGIRAFHHSGLTNLTIPYNVTSIGDGAFNWCPLESIKEIPNWCTASSYFLIEDNVLYNADKTELILYPPFKTDTTFTIPETVIRINKYAFEENYYMEKIRINNAMVTLEGLCGLMNIKEFECYSSDGIISQTANGYKVLANEETNKGYLFYNEYLCRVPVDETSIIGCPYSFNGCLSGAFAGCTELIEIDTSQIYCANDNEMLPYKCFYKCENLILSELNTLNIHGVGIDDYAFAYCNSITDLCLNIDNSSAISSFTFNEYSIYNSTQITNVHLSVGTQNVITKTHSFENCQQLTVLSFPSFPDSTEITSEKNAFLNTANNQSNLQCEVFNNQLIGIFGVPDNGQIKTPISDNKTIWKIWKVNPNVASIVLGEGMTKLMGYTFCNGSYSRQGWSFNNLQHIKFPSTLAEIGGYAFYKTNLNMNAVDFSACNNITIVEPYAFYEVQNININLENLRYVGQYAFYCSVFKNPINININDDSSLVVYEKNAFYYTLGLENINISCSDIYVGMCLSNISLNNNLCDFRYTYYYNNTGNIANSSLSNNGTGYTFCGRLYENTTKEYYSTIKNISIISKNSYFYGGCNFLDNYKLETLVLQSENQIYTNSMQNYARCWNLKDVTVSGSVNQSDFSDCYKLKSVKFYKMQSPTAIASNYSFEECNIIDTLDFSESELTEINMQKSSNYYYPFGYSKLYCLKNLILPDNLTSLTIAGLGLKGKNLNLPKTLKTLIIDECPGLSEIDIPSSVTSITFKNSYNNYNHSIRKLKVPNSCTVNNAYYEKNGAKIPIKITYY